MISFIKEMDGESLEDSLVIDIQSKLKSNGLTPLRKLKDNVEINYSFSRTNTHLYINWDEKALEVDDRNEKYFEIRYVLSKEIASCAQKFNFENVYFQSNLDSKLRNFEISLATDITSLFSDALYTELSKKIFFFSKHLTENDYEQTLRMMSSERNARKWVNENPDELTSIEIGTRLKKFASNHDCEYIELGDSEIKEKGLNLLYQVGKASKLSPPRLFILTKNMKKGEKPLTLVGKAITFDSGGINVKPHELFVNCMKNDMGGGALASNLFMAMVESGYDKPLALVIPSCENLVDGESMKPGSIIKSFKGTDVIIEHTDAEGRLILADGMAYAQSLFTPSLTVLFATLTTAALRQFTSYYTPVHFADSTFKEKLTRHAITFGENFTFWNRLNLFREANDKKGIGLTNIGSLNSHASMGGGSNVAAHFLKHFCVGPYIHFDIFASGWNWSGDYPGASYGATGAGFYSILKTLKEY